MIYFDHAATTINKPECVLDAVYQAMKNAGNASRGSHHAALSSIRMIYDTREMISGMFGLSKPEQTVFTSNATESLNMAIKGSFSPGDHVITTSLEHNSVLRPLYELEDKGLLLTILKADESGNISYEEMEDAVNPNTKGIVCTHGSNLTGNLLDLKRIGKICSKHQLRFIVDASQTAGLFPIDMMDMQIDILCFTGHKSLLGPQGTGGLCLKEHIKLPPYKTGGSGIHTFDKKHPDTMPEALEAGTLNAHGIAGLQAGIKYLKVQGPEKLLDKELMLMHQFFQGVNEVPAVKIYGDFSKKIRAPIVTINIGDYDSSTVADELSVRFDIAVRAGAHCAPLMHECLHTKAQGAVRFSFSHSNTEKEVAQAVRAVQTLATEDS